MNHNEKPDILSRIRSIKLRRELTVLLAFMVMLSTSYVMIHPGEALNNSTARTFMFFNEEEGMEETAVPDMNALLDADRDSGVVEEVPAEEIQSETETAEETYSSAPTQTPAETVVPTLEPTATPENTATAEAEGTPASTAMTTAESENSSDPFSTASAEPETTGTPEATETPEAEDEVFYPAIDFGEITPLEADGTETEEDIKVIIKAPEGAFPEGTTVKVVLVRDTEILDAIEKAAVDAAEDNVTVKQVQAVDITFFDKDGNEIQPAKPIAVSFKSELVKEAENTTVVHVKQDENKEKITDTKTVDTIAKPEDSDLVDSIEANEVVIEADSFSVYGIVGTELVTEWTLPGSSDTYEIKVIYDENARIPDGSTLRVTEFAGDSDEYITAKAAVVKNKKSEDENYDETEYGFLAFDLSIVDPYGNVVEPAEGAEVKVSVQIKEMPEDTDKETLSETIEIHHLDESTGSIRVDMVADEEAVSEEGDDVKAEFNTSSFSTYTISYRHNNTTVSITVHYVTEDGNDIPDDVIANSEVPFDQTIGGPTRKGDQYSLRFNLEGYRYVTTRLNSMTGTQIYYLLQTDAAKDTDKTITNANRYWKYRQLNNTSINAYTQLPDNTRDIYVVYRKGLEEDDSGSDGEITPTTDAPVTEKNVGSNGDGTYDVSLSVTGKSQKSVDNPRANVAIVFDTSNSMRLERQTSSTGWMGSEWNSQGFLRATVQLYTYQGRQMVAANAPVEESVTVYRRVSSRQTNNDIQTGGYWYTPYTGERFSNYINDAHQDRLAVGQSAMKTLAAGLLGMNTTDSEKIELAFVNFSHSVRNETTINTFYSGTSTTTFNSMIDNLNTDGGTNWDIALEAANSILWEDNDPVYIIFVSDGNTVSRSNRNGDGDGWDGGTYYESVNVDNIEDDPHWKAAKNQVDAIQASGKTLYTIGVFGDVSNLEALGGDAHFDVSDEAGLQNAFSEILASITSEVGYESVTVNDGITAMTSTSLVNGNVDQFHYTVEKNGVTTEYNTGAALQAEYPDIGLASYDQSQKTVVWNMGDDYMLEDGVTYTVSFTVWPSQKSYDLIADLNNGVKYYSYEQYVASGGTLSEGAAKEAGIVISKTDQDQIIDDDGIYYLKTNTSATIDYTSIKTVDGVETEKKTVTGSEIKDPNGKMKLDVSKMKVEKKFAHSINAQDPYTKLNFYIKVDGKYYNTDGSTSTDLNPEKVYTIELPKAGNWYDEIFISPGLIKKNGTFTMPPLEPGHNYTVEEIITEGSVYEYEFTPQVMRPMVIGTTLTFLVQKDKYNTNPGNHTEYEIDGITYYVESENDGTLTGTNRKTAELDITKIVNDPEDLLTAAEENAETFTYRVTLSIPDGSDPAGIVGYEYVPRTQSNAFTLYGYQTGETAFETDISRFSGKTFRGWNTLAYRDLVEWELVDGRIVSKTDEDGNIIWKIPAEGGYHTITYDMTLKQDEVIRFTNLPSGTKYTIQEIYANKYPADNAGGTTTGRAPISDTSNIASEGYEITQILHTGGEISEDTVTGTIEDLDTRYYNQFTNTVKSHHDVRAELKVKKTVKYPWPTDQYYNFTLTAGTATYTDGTTGTSPMPDNTSATSVRSIYDNDTTPDHTASFGVIPYSKAGSYTYTVEEAWAPAYAQKPAKATITVTVEEQSDRLVVTNIEDDLGTTEFTPANNTAIAAGLTTQVNTIKTISVSATKEWLKADGTTVIVNPPAGSKATFTLYVNGEATDLSVELDGTADDAGESEPWVATFSNLEQYKVTTVETTTGEGENAVTTVTNTYEEIEYTIGETSLSAGFEKVTLDPVPNGGTIQNKQLARDVNIQKRRQDGSTPLNGAIFDLYTKDGYESVPKAAPIKTNLTSEKIEDIDGVIRLGELTYGEYYLVETTAPAGYNILTEAVKLTVNANRISILQGGTLRTDDDPEDTDYKAFITNDEGVELPMTGGTGTLPYTLGGITVMLTALMYGFRMRRRERRLY